MVWAIQHFESYIHSMHFAVITDHFALKALKDKANLTGCLLIRADKLMEYDFDIVYRSGKENVVPDFLSRIYLVEKDLEVDEDEELVLAQRKN